MKLPLFDRAGQPAGEIEGAKEIFEQAMNEQVVHDTEVWYLASQRRGTHSSLTRSEGTGGGKKPWKQKGTGRARAGSIRSPLWRKGGVVFGPKPRDYGFALPKKVKQLALKVILSDKAREGKIKVASALDLAEAKTKAAVKFLSDLQVGGKTLIVTAEPSANFLRAARNVAGVSVTDYKELNVHDLLNNQWIVLEKKAAENLKEFLD